MEKIKYYFYMFKDNLTHKIANYRAQSPERFKKLTYIAAIAMFLIFAGIAVYIIFFKKKAVEESVSDAIQVKVIRVAKQDYTDKYTVMGMIKGAIENDMRFEIEGHLALYNYKEGDQIPKGQNKIGRAHV